MGGTRRPPWMSLLSVSVSYSIVVQVGKRLKIDWLFIFRYEIWVYFILPEMKSTGLYFKCLNHPATFSLPSFIHL